MLNLKKRLASVLLTAVLVISAMPAMTITSYADDIDLAGVEEITNSNDVVTIEENVEASEESENTSSLAIINKDNTARYDVVPFAVDSSDGMIDSAVERLEYSNQNWACDEEGNWYVASETRYTINLYTVHVNKLANIEISFTDGNRLAYGYADAKYTYLSSCGNSENGEYAGDSQGESSAIDRPVSGAFPRYVFVQTPYTAEGSEDLYAIQFELKPDEEGEVEPVVEDESDRANTSEVVATYMSNKVGDEWYAMSLARDGKDVPEDYFKALAEEVKAKEGKIAKITDLAKYALVLTAGGFDATQVEGYDLIAEMAIACDEKIAANKLDAYSAIYALLALDSHDYLNTEDGKKLRSDIVKASLKAKLWDVDTKGMLVQALAPYMGDDEVLDDETRQAVIDKVNELDASFDSDLATINNSNTLAQVILAKAALGKDAEPAVEMLKDYELENGAYCWKPDKKGNKVENKMATYQAYQAIISADNAKNGRNSFYDMSDVKELKPLGDNKKPDEAGTEAPEIDEPAAKPSKTTNTVAANVRADSSSSKVAAVADETKPVKAEAKDEVEAGTKNASSSEVSSRTIMYVGAGALLFLLALLVLRKLIKESSK